MNIETPPWIQAKKCPNCGSKLTCLVESWKNSLVFDYEQQETQFSIECFECGMRGPFGDTEEISVEKWDNLTRIK